jgi:4-amino-4-deoxychorismate mutase
VSAREQETSAAVVGLEPFRRRLDELDEEIALRLGERFAICREIALYKRDHDIPMMQPGRVEQVRSRYLARGSEVELPAAFTTDMFELLIAATCRMEDELIAREQPHAREGDLPGDGLGETASVAREGGKSG